MDKKINLLGLNKDSLRIYFSEIGENAFRANQLIKWIYQHGVTDFSNMTNLSLALRNELSDVAQINYPKIVSEQTSHDGTRKWLLAVDEQNHIETVFIPEKDRGTLCISSQVGCPLRCSFCATGKQGFNRNLSSAEIIGQLFVACQALGIYQHKQHLISNIVMMGMGEPLLNFQNVMAAINLMMDDHAFGISRKRITLSTAGLVPGIYKLAETSDVNLAISLHATNDELRNELVPINKTFPLEKLLAACKHYANVRPNRVITFEYVMLDGINDSEEEAHLLIQLLKGIPAKINIIPFNDFPASTYQCSNTIKIDKFRDVLIRAGLITVTRKTRGEDIDAACGQLIGNFIPYKLDQIASVKL
ncbi:Ribosomal RNA large subunit methyltransferase N [uncultured Candidatus Thioglobus sp.]|nr:Ribosomal RNA large subunit methyltransferase N [uncultured Candidatus Thioglobus sp.]